jgi:hypothetical protein
VGKAISTFFKRTLGAVPLENLLRIGSVFPCFGNPECMVVTAFETTAFVAGVTNGDLDYALRSGFIAAATAVAFYLVGGSPMWLGENRSSQPRSPLFSTRRHTGSTSPAMRLWAAPRP